MESRSVSRRGSGTTTKKDILDAVPGSFLEEYNDFNIEASFCLTASVSMAYAMMSRCNLEPDEYFQHGDFLSVFDT